MSPGSDAAAADTNVTIRAIDMRFEQQVVNVAAGEPFTILLRNQDGVPHNVAIYADRSRSLKLFAGELVTSADVLYQVAAVEPGTYFFLCELHPNMTGQLIAE